ncbi:AlpA family phage regulatory protein [Sphingomonas sp. BIUV-7]|uniref:AlpA family phage regulatory protein n=1 Tax=Sphingomonas natans TaxID=3063330 RepID=A0ABT8YCL4_9SPHN|nr:AlpA family phage regulatory protein [Sphingomonas sp. BIUV-7]MDO6416091.1 AlpA family phage regulatory protein [Sphingomonas sp. BIUV-7]
MTTYSPDRIIRLKTVIAETGLSRSTIYRRMEKGTFPQKLKIADRCVGWRASAVTRWSANPDRYREEAES